LIAEKRWASVKETALWATFGRAAALTRTMLLSVLIAYKSLC
jgi:hypothetical protein